MSVKRALVCSPLMPEYDKESGGQSILDLILFLREAGWAVSFACENPADGLRYRRILQQRGVAVYERFDARLDELITYGRLDLAILCFWYIGEQLIRRIRTLSPGTRIAINTMDLHFLREARKATSARAGTNRGGVAENGWGSELARELTTYAAADAVFCVSEREVALVTEILGGATPGYAVTDYEHIPPSPYKLAERSGILFVGNFRHPPNSEAVTFLCEEIVPSLDADLLAEHPIYVVGTDLSEKLRRLGESVNGVRMVGWVPTLTPYYHRARIAIAPLLHGGGTKRKILQALTVGLPVVSTTTGVEGFQLTPGADIVIADQPDDFAAGITSLVRDSALWRRIARRGREAVADTFHRDAVGERYLAIVDRVLAVTPKRVELTTEELTDDGPIGYAHMVDRVGRIVGDRVPAGAKVAVVSRGDDRLTNFDNADGCHFPQIGGVYAGHHPADSADAIEQLESLRATGVDYLLFPRTAFWWLDYYDGFRSHLTQWYQEIVTDMDTCRVFALASKRRPRSDATDKQVATPSADPTEPVVA